MRAVLRVLVVTVAAALPLSGCGAPSQYGAGPPATPSGNAGQRGTGAYDYLYVTEPTINQLEILDPTYKVVKTITTGLSRPVGDYVDSKGNLYVANQNSNSCAGGGNVVEYAHGSTSPTYTYSSGLVCPLFVGADASGNVFAYDYEYGGLSNELVEFAQGQNTPINSWSTCNTGTYAFCYGPTGLTMGPAGTVLLSMYGAVHGSLGTFWVVDEVFYQQKSNNQYYATGYTGPAGGVAIDKKLNILAGAEPIPPSGSGGARPQSGPGGWTVVKTPRKKGTDFHLVNLKYQGFTFVNSLALSSDQKTLFVDDFGGKTVTLLSYPKGKFVKSLGTANGLTDPGSAALGPSP